MKKLILLVVFYLSLVSIKSQISLEGQIKAGFAPFETSSIYRKEVIISREFRNTLYLDLQATLWYKNIYVKQEVLNSFYQALSNGFSTNCVEYETSIGCVYKAFSFGVSHRSVHPSNERFIKVPTLMIKKVQYSRVFINYTFNFILN